VKCQAFHYEISITILGIREVYEEEILIAFNLVLKTRLKKMVAFEVPLLFSYGPAPMYTAVQTACWPALTRPHAESNENNSCCHAN
jgi:hypothetical protein